MGGCIQQEGRQRGAAGFPHLMKMFPSSDRATPTATPDWDAPAWSSVAMQGVDVAARVWFVIHEQPLCPKHVSMSCSNLHVAVHVVPGIFPCRPAGSRAERPLPSSLGPTSMQLPAWLFSPFPLLEPPSVHLTSFNAQRASASSQPRHAPPTGFLTPTDGCRKGGARRDTIPTPGLTRGYNLTTIFFYYYELQATYKA